MIGSLLHWWNGLLAPWSALFITGEWIIRIVMLLVVPFRRSPDAARGWLLLVFFEPVLGLTLYLIIGRPTPPRWRAVRFRQLPAALAPTIERLRRSATVLRPDMGPALAPIIALAERLGTIPITGGNQAEILTDYLATIERLVAEIDAATHHVHLLFYIFADDDVGGRVIEALQRASGRGVQCRVLIDSVGSKPWRRTVLHRLVAAGVQAHAVLPVGPLRRRAGRIDLRNHRKIAVMDGRVGYTGSLNIVNPDFKPGLTYEELMVRVTGPVTLALQFLFAGDWYVETGELLDDVAIFPAPVAEGAVAAQALPSGPLYPHANNQWLITALVHSACTRVVITTPYFVPDAPLLQAVQTAVLRGAEVHLVVPGQDDQLLVTLAQKSYYGELLDAGVRIHRYQPRFLHAKHVTIDDQVSWIGSSNMDVRSFVLNEEVVLLFYDRQLTAQLVREQQRYFRDSHPLTADQWRRRPRRTRIVQNLARLLSPLL
ncbi:MAG: cardiolipin synthase [Gemmatimonadota bacterium]